jgi:hypothetical protein
LDFLPREAGRERNKKRFLFDAKKNLSLGGER